MVDSLKFGFDWCRSGFWGWFGVRWVGGGAILYVCSKTVCFPVSWPVVRLVG